MPLQQITANDILNGTITGSDIAANTISGTSFQTGSVESYMNSQGTQLAGMRNRIINGAMMIDQRNVGASVTQSTAIQYCVDRFQIVGNVASKFTAQQTDVPSALSGFIKALKITSSSAYSVGAGDYFMLRQPIEGLNCADLGWGTANAQSVTLTFKVYSSLTGTFGGAIENSGGNRSYAFSYTVSSANTWTNVSVTIPGDTTGTWVTDNGLGLQLAFALGVGSTYSGTAGSWGATRYFSVTGATSVVETNGATFYITGVQLEKGSVATPFENRLITTELQLCQRYFCKSGPFDSAIQSPGATYSNPFFVASTLNAYSANNGYIPTVYFPVNMRATPTIVIVPTGLGPGGTANSQTTIYNAGTSNWVVGTSYIQSSSAISFNLSCSGTWTAAATISYFGWTSSAEI